ncbi:N-acetylmuramoyl-L-alanine amidase [Deinococcus cavernae]|uniref:N-acetylmuramoyl-L-alanine amidase n=1 Tax=Deinococcus cavernae TaxID=2320857 RepID=A0A418V688_9DEIO|nr:N-acetylmuramoyl-L-alanine amidase [Deinococcus cavernae]RJF71610.1 N-acetylmuramoyl-L-alanine amidase [Deinococcus cavernae]
MPAHPLTWPTRKPGRLLLTLLVLGAGNALAAPDVFIAYPPPEYRVRYANVIVEGSVTPGATLTINGKAVAVGPDGLFMEWWPLKAGVNTLKFVTRQGKQAGSATLRVTRTLAQGMPATPTAIARTSVTPRENIEFWDAARDTPAERTVPISFQGSPGGKASFRVAGGPPLALREGLAGTYSGQYTLPENASALNAAITVSLTGRNGRTVSAAAPGRLTSLQGALKTGVQKPGSVRGLGLNDATTLATTLTGEPALYPRDGMTFTLVGRVGQDVRARLGSGNSILITARQLIVTPGAPPLAQSGPLSINSSAAVTTPPASASGAVSGSVPVPVTAAVSVPPVPVITVPAVPATPSASPAVSAPPVSSTTTGPAPASAASPVSTLSPPPVEIAPVSPPQVTPTQVTDDLQLRIPLGGARVPFQVTQTNASQLQLDLHGLLIPPTPPTQTHPLLRGVRIAQVGGSTRLTVDLNTPQLWGFTANYDSQGLLLTIRRPPTLNPAQPLAGRVITLDPGHGGTQKGGAGSLRVPEKGLVLPIALRVAELLRAQGASVNLTRTGDVTLGLYERDLLAEATNSDLLVSIHANALPDGRDPRGIRGPEVYYTHPQAQAVSQSILSQLRARLPDLGPGQGLMPGANLALTRPTTQISLLVETAYLTDAGNLRALMSPEGRERFAQAIAQGIVDFYVSQAR